MKSSAERKAAERARKRQAGMKPYEMWLSAKELKAVRRLLKQLRASGTVISALSSESAK